MKDVLIDAIAALSPGVKVVISGTIIALFATVSTGVTEPSPYVQLPAIILSGLVIMSGVFLIFYRGYAEAKRDERSLPRPSFEPSERITNFSKEVLSAARTRDELSKLTFSAYNNLTKPQLYSLLMQSTARECVLCGQARFDGVNYLDCDATDRTTYE